MALIAFTGPVPLHGDFEAHSAALLAFRFYGMLNGMEHAVTPPPAPPV